MGIFKDTYYIDNRTHKTNIDTSSIAKEMSRYNDIQEKEYETKNRLDISLKEYEELKDRIKELEHKLYIDNKILCDIFRKYKITPELFDKGANFKTELIKSPIELGYHLHIDLFFNDFDIECAQYEEW